MPLFISPAFLGFVAAANGQGQGGFNIFLGEQNYEKFPLE